MHTCVLSHFSHVQLFVTPWTVARQAPLSMEFSRKLEWLDIPSPGDLPDLGVEPESLTSLVLTGGFFTTGATWEAQYNVIYNVYLSLFFFKELIQGEIFHE